MRYYSFLYVFHFFIGFLSTSYNILNKFSNKCVVVCLDCMNNNAISGRPLFPQWSNHVYPQFLPSSHPHSTQTAYPITSSLPTQPANHRLAARHYSAHLSHPG